MSSKYFPRFCLSPRSGVAVTPRTFAEEHLDDDIDILTYHNYSITPEHQSLQRTAELKALFANRPGARLKEFWQGESGRATKPHHSDFFACTEYNMAKFIVRRLYTDAVSGVKVSSIFTASELNQYYPDGTSQEFGLFKADPCRPKLAAFAFQGMCKMLAGLTYDPQSIVHAGTPHSAFAASRLNYQVMAHAFRRNGIPVFGIYLPEHEEMAHSSRIASTCEDMTHSEIARVLNQIRIEALAGGSEITTGQVLNTLLDNLHSIRFHE